MPTRVHVKRNDEVVVLSGTEKGKRGKIIAVYPSKERVIVEGVKLIKKHMRKSQRYPEGAIIEREGTIHVSNVMLASRHDAREERRESGASQSDE